MTQNQYHSFFRKVAAGFWLTSAILVSIGLASHRSTAQLLKSTDQTQHTLLVIKDLQSVLSQIKDAETGQRGYLLTAEERYLEPYHSAHEGVEQKVKALRKLTADNPNQQWRLDTLELLIAKKLAELNETIALRKDKGFEPAMQIVKTDKGKNLMDNIRRVIHDMENEENVLLTKRSQLTSVSAYQTIFNLFYAFGVIFLMLAGFYYLIRSEITERLLAEETRRKSHTKSG